MKRKRPPGTYRDINSTFESLFYLNKPTSKLEAKRFDLPSAGERKIAAYLSGNNIKFESEKSFKGLRNWRTGKSLRFDFYLPDFKTCIEFDGIQHFKRVHKYDKDGKDSLDERQYRDNLKDEFCIKNNITLLRIKYSQISLIADLIEKQLNSSQF